MHRTPTRTDPDPSSRNGMSDAILADDGAAACPSTLRKATLNLADLPDACNIEQARRALGIGKNLILDLIREGDLPSVRLGRRVIIPKSAIRRLLQAGD